MWQGQMGRVCRKYVEMRLAYKMLSEYLKGKDHLEDLKVDVRTVVK
jgi:hypothetical protein